MEQFIIVGKPWQSMVDLHHNNVNKNNVKSILHDKISTMHLVDTPNLISL